MVDIVVHAFHHGTRQGFHGERDVRWLVREIRPADSPGLVADVQQLGQLHGNCMQIRQYQRVAAQQADAGQKRHAGIRKKSPSTGGLLFVAHVSAALM